MLLSEITPKYIVLNKSYDDFAKDTEQIDYETEDFVSQVTDITSVLYTNSLESIWGFLGFVWDEFNVKGHFNTISMPFSIIPRIPDAYRLKEFPSNMFENIKSINIEVLDSDFTNVTKLGNIANTNKRYIFHFDSINIPKFIDFNTEGFNGTSAPPTQEEIDRYAFGSLELYNKSFTGLKYMLMSSTFRNYYSTWVITDKNKEYFKPKLRSQVFNAFYYKEDKPFIISDCIHTDDYSIEKAFNIFISKQNKFTICCSSYRNWNNYFKCFKVQDEYAPILTDNINSYLNLDNILDITFEFKQLDKPNSIGNIDNFKCINSLDMSYCKRFKFDYTNFDNYINEYGTLYCITLIRRLIVIPELNNIDTFLNEDYNTIFKYIAEGKIKPYANYNYFFTEEGEEIKWVIISNLFININTEKKVLDLNHAKVGLNLEYINNLYNINDEKPIRNNSLFKLVNAENAIIAFYYRNCSYTIKDNNFSYTIGTTNIVNDEPIICKGFRANINIIAIPDKYAIETSNIILINNCSIRIELTDYTFDTIPNNLKPVLKFTIDGNKRRNDESPIINNLIYYDSIFLGEHTDQELYDKLNELYPEGIQLIEIDNKVNYQFTTDDDFKLNHFIINIGGGAVSKFKTSNLKVKGPNYLINNKTNKSNTYFSNNVKYIVMHKMKQFDLFYNSFIYVVTIQDDIHAFINAFMDEELPEDRIGLVDIQIVHENFIQLTDDEKNKIIRLGYNLIDTII